MREYNFVNHNRSKEQDRVSFYGFIIVPAVCIIILILFSWHMYPVPGGDSVYFLPAARWMLMHGQIANKVVDFAYITDPSNQGSFLFYPPGFVYLLSCLSSFLRSDYRSILISLAFLRSAGIFFFTLSVYNLARHNHRRRIFVFIGTLIVLSNSLFLFPSNGRPEILTMTLISMAVAVGASGSSQKNKLIVLLISLIFSISLANGIIGISFYAIYLIYSERKVVNRLRSLIGLVLLCLAVFFISYLISGVDIKHGMYGLIAHSRWQIRRGNTSPLTYLKYWYPWFIFGFLSIVEVLRRFGRTYGEGLMRGVPQALYGFLSFMFLTANIYIFGLRTAYIHYNFYAWLPLFQVLSFGLFLNVYDPMSRFFEKRRIVHFTVIAACAFSLAMPVRDILVFPYYLMSGRDYSKMRPIFKALADDSECQILYSSGLTVLDEELKGSVYRLYENGKATSRRYEEEAVSDKECKIIFVQEVNSPSRVPAYSFEVLDMSDDSNMFHFLRRMRILNSPKGYSFKVYRQ